VLLVVVSSYAVANTVTYITPVGSTEGGQAVKASVTFTTSSNTVKIDLTNMLTAAQMISVGQDLGDLQFKISSPFSGTVDSADNSYSGTLVNVDGSGNVTPGSGTFSKWGFSNTGSTFLLADSGFGQPTQTIIGGAGASS